jgi:hypothetical protein
MNRCRALLIPLLIEAVSVPRLSRAQEQFFTRDDLIGLLSDKGRVDRMLLALNTLRLNLALAASEGDEASNELAATRDSHIEISRRRYLRRTPALCRRRSLRRHRQDVQRTTKYVATRKGVDLTGRAPWRCAMRRPDAELGEQCRVFRLLPRNQRRALQMRCQLWLPVPRPRSPRPGETARGAASTWGSRSFSIRHSFGGAGDYNSGKCPLRKTSRRPRRQELVSFYGRPARIGRATWPKQVRQ